MRLSELPLSPGTRELIEASKIPTLHLLLPDCNLPPAALAKGRDALCSQLSARAVELPEPPAPIATSSRVLDDALSGGLLATRLVQLAGSSQSGKSMLAASFATSTLSRGECVIWLETSAAVSDVRGRLAGLVDEHSLTRLVVIPLTTLNHAVAVLQAIKEDNINLRFVKPENAMGRALARPRLVVLDSLASLVAPVLGLRKASWTGHAAFNALMVLMRWLATHSAATVVLTNRVVRRPDGPKPALGNLLACYADVTVLLERIEETADGSDLYASVWSKRGPDRRVVMSVGENGILEDEDEVDDSLDEG